MIYENYILYENEASPGDSTSTQSDGVSTSIPAEVTTEITTEEIDEDSFIVNGYDYQYSDIEFLMPFNEETSEYDMIAVDNRPYMSCEVSGATINDVYTMVLSMRNIVLLWFLFWLIVKTKSMIHNIVAKYMERGK